METGSAIISQEPGPLICDLTLTNETFFCIRSSTGRPDTQVQVSHLEVKGHKSGVNTRRRKIWNLGGVGGGQLLHQRGRKTMRSNYALSPGAGPVVRKDLFTFGGDTPCPRRTWTVSGSPLIQMIPTVGGGGGVVEAPLISDGPACDSDLFCVHIKGSGEGSSSGPAGGGLWSPGINKVVRE